MKGTESVRKIRQKWRERRLRNIRAKNVVIVITNLDSGRVDEYTAASLAYHFAGDDLPFAIFPGSSRYELSIRRRTK